MIGSFLALRCPGQRQGWESWKEWTENEMVGGVRELARKNKI